MAQLYELNLRDYWNIFLKRRLMVVVSFFAVSAGIYIYTYLQTPIYTAAAMVKIDQYAGLPSEVVFPANKTFWMREENITDYTKQMTSSAVLELAARDAGLVNDNMTGKEKNLVLSRIGANVSAAGIEKTNMIRLQVSSGDPEAAADLANKILFTFKRLNLEQKNQQAYNVRVFIENNLSDVSKKLKEQDNKLRELTMRGALGSGVNIVNQIYELEKKRGDLLTKFTGIHPEVTRIDEQIAELKEALKTLPTEEFEYGVLKRDITINESLYTNLKQKLPEAQIKEVEKVDNVIIINLATPPKDPSYPDKKKNYAVGIALGLMLGITMALVTEHIDTSIGRVEDIENFIKVSVLGVVPFSSRKNDKGETHKTRGWGNIFSRKKNIGKGSGYEASNIFSMDHSASSIFMEAFRILGVNLQVMFGKGGKIKNKVLLVTSCNPDEGKSVVTSNLAVILSQMGYRTLIMDADSRRSTIHKIFGLKNKEGGLLDVLTGKILPDDAVKTATDLMLGISETSRIMDNPWLDNLNILTSGSVFPNAVNLFNSQKMDDVLNYFKNKYDVVLIDTSPILAVSEPSIIIPKVDGVLLVYKAGVTSRIALRRAKMQIDSVSGKDSFLGVVLNNVTPEIGVDTYYYYSKKYDVGK